MKTFFKTIGWAILYDLTGCVVYLFMMLLFAWMAHWWWLFIILIGIGSMSIFIGLSQMASSVAIHLNKNWFGKILAILITAHLLYFSIHAVWSADFLAEYEKEITVKIIATIVFAFAYCPVFFMTFFKQNINTSKYD